jgi:PAS domain S-box-containing protein
MPSTGARVDRFAAFAAATGQIMWTASPDGRFQDVGSWCAYTGEREAQVREAGWLAAVHPEDRSRAEAAWRTALGEGSRLECELRVRRFDGVYRTFLVRAAPLTDAGGVVQEWVGFCADISQRAGRELETQTAIEALAQIAEVIILPLRPAPDFSVSGTHLVAGSLAELTRRMLACVEVAIAMFEQPTQQLVPLAAAGFALEENGQERTARLVQLVGEYVDAGALARLGAGDEMLIPQAQGHPAIPDFERMLLLVPLAAGKELLGVLAVTYSPGYLCTASQRMLAVTVGKLIALVIERERLLRERSEARASAIAMHEAKREMDEFLSIASHELKTPLTSIRGFIQLAEQRLRALATQESTRNQMDGIASGEYELAAHVERVQTALERAEYQTGQMTRLINELLDASRVHVSRLELHVACHDLAALVRETVEEQRLTWPGRVIQVLESDAGSPIPERGPAASREAVSGKPVMVLMDGARMSQVLANFLTNALKYSPAAHPVLVRLDVTADRATVAVCDAGPGIPLDEQARVWERFYRSKRLVTQFGAEGLGLGLYISRAIVERHGGRVGLASEPGAGATFSFTLPLAAAQ